ncbi:Crp/Fnr family transcriptional regulator, partial [Burkholderia cepacia]
MWFNCRQPNGRYCEPSVIETTECLSRAARYPYPRKPAPMHDPLAAPPD